MQQITQMNSPRDSEMGEIFTKPFENPNDHAKTADHSNPPQEKRVFIFIFILLNVYKPLSLLLLGAISISGLNTSLSKYILYSLLGMFTVVSSITIPSIFFRIKRPWNIWTSVIFCESLKENRVSSLVGVM
jgi:hypothetical protein